MADIISTDGLESFFTRGFSNNYESFKFYDTGYQTSILDILYQKARRTKGVSQNKIYDLIQLENDPNHNRGINGRTYEKLISKLSIATQILAMVQSNLHMANIYEFIPSNLRNLMGSFQSISDTGINFLSNINQGLTFNQIEQALLADLRLQYANGDITFLELTAIANAILDNQNLQESVENNGLRPLLALQLQNLLPSSMTGIFSDLQFLDELAEIITNDDIRNSFLRTAEQEIEDYSKLYPTDLDNVNNNYYLNSTKITLEDPLGIKVRDSFKTDLFNSYSSELISIVTTNPDLTTLQKEQTYELLLADASQNVEAAFKGKIGLPSLNLSIKGVNSESYNKSVEKVLSAFDIFFRNDIIPKIDNIKGAPADLSPGNYLFNLKRNIEKRLEMESRGTTNSELAEIEKVLKQTYLKTNVIPSKVILENILIQLNQILR